MFGLQCGSGAGDEFGGDGGKGSRLVFRRRGNDGDRRPSDAETAEVVEVLVRGVVVTAGFGAFAPADFFVDEAAGEGVDVADKTAGGSTGGTGETGSHAVVGL